MIKIKPHRNSFDLLRLIAATAVLYSHQHALLGLPEPEVFRVKTLGFFGVMIFFILSGWLIAQSWERDPHAGRYLSKRVLRIFPALIAVVLLSVLLLGPLFTQLPLSDYCLSHQTWKYFFTTLLWIHYPLPGVFDSNPYPSIVNGSLWTLPVEFLLYLSVLGVGFLGFFKKTWLSFFVLLACTVLPGILIRSGSDVLLTGSECLFVFWWGVNLGQAEKAVGKLKNQMRSFLLLSLLLLGLGLGSAGFSLLVLFAAYLILFAARTSLGDLLTRKIGDLSYGVYIFAFPVQQMSIAIFGAKTLSFWYFLSISLFATFMLAALSWHWIEKPFIKLKPGSKRS